MKKIIVFYLIFLAPYILFSLNVKQDSFGDIKIFPTRNYNEADLVVYITDVDDVAKDKEEIWLWSENKPDIRINITNIQSAADIIVYFTSFQTQAGWKKNNPLRGKLFQWKR